MNHLNTTAALLLACSMGIGSLALAQDRGRGPPERQGERQGERQDDRRAERSGNRQDDRRTGPSDRSQRDLRNDRRAGPVLRPAPLPVYRVPPAPPPRWARPGDRDQWRYEGRGAGPDRSFYRGNRLPSYYRSRQYMVEDWRGHRLSAPPSGYQWVQTGSDYVLIAVATGIILQILLSQ